MKPFRRVPASFLKSALLAPLLLSLPGVSRAQMVTTATYTANDGGSANLNQKVIAVGTDGYSRFIVWEGTGAPDYGVQLTYVRCLDVPCDSYNTKSWPIDHISPFAFSLAIGPDGYARIAYQLYEMVYDDAGEYHSGILGFIQCADVDCGSSTNDSFVDYVADDAIASVAVGSDGTAYIAYDNGNADDGPQGIGLATCNGSSCSTTSIASGFAWSDQTTAATIIGSDGNPAVAYVDEIYSVDTNSYVFSTGHYYQNGTDVVVSDDASITDLAIGPDGSARILFGNSAWWANSGETPGVNFIECTNASCSSATVNPISVPGVIGSVAVVADGSARILVDEGTGNSTYYVECTAADCSTYDSSQISANSGDSGSGPSIVADPNGFPRMIVQDTHGVVYQIRPLVPTSLSIVPGTDSTTIEATCSAGPAGTGCGVNRSFVYQVNDQDGNPLQFSGLPVWDSISTTSPNNLDIGGYNTTCGSYGTSQNQSGPCSLTTNSNGQFGEGMLGACSPVCYVSNACTTGGPTKANQTWHVGNASIVQQLSYYCDHMTVNGQ